MTTAVESEHAPAVGPASAVRPETVGCVVIGVHGGAGASTLVRLLDPSRSGEFVEWKAGMAPQFDRLPLLVARSTAHGAAVAASFITRWRPDILRPVLMVVADVPFAVPPVVRYRQRALSSQVTALIKVPYLYPLRYLDDPTQALRQRKVASTVERLRCQLQAMAAASGGL